MTDSFDYEAFKQAAIKGLYEGRPLTGQDGLFAPIALAHRLKHFLETALEPGRRSGGWIITSPRPANLSKTAVMARILSR